MLNLWKWRSYIDKSVSMILFRHWSIQWLEWGLTVIMKPTKLQRESSTRAWNVEEKKFRNKRGREKGMVRRKSNQEERFHLLCNVVTAVKCSITTLCQICPSVSVQRVTMKGSCCAEQGGFMPQSIDPVSKFDSSFSSEWACFVPGTFPNPWHLTASTEFPSAAASVQINGWKNCVRFWLLFHRMKGSV